MILLYSEKPTGTLIVRKSVIHEGTHAVPSREYHINEHFIVVDRDDEVLSHYEALLLLEHEGVRLATPHEQNQYMRMKRGQSSIQE